MFLEKFGKIFWTTVLVLLAVQYVLCVKTDLDAALKGKEEVEESVENVLDDLVKDFGNSTFSLIEDMLEEEDVAEARGIEESPNQSKSPKKGSIIEGIGGGSGGGHSGGAGGGHGSSGGGKRKRKNQKKQQSLYKRILPIMFIPFMISTAIIPLMIFVIKLLFIKAAIVGKVAVILGLISFFKRRSSGGGVYNYNAWKSR